MYARPKPGWGLMSPRIQTAGPNMNLLLDGWLRPVTDLKGDKRQRFRPSSPTVNPDKRMADRDARNSRIGLIFGCAFDMDLKVSSSSNSDPSGRIGHSMFSRARYWAHRDALNVSPSKTPKSASTCAISAAFNSSQLAAKRSSITTSIGTPTFCMWLTAFM